MTTSTLNLQFFDAENLDSFTTQDFKAAQPFPWANFYQFLTPDTFNALHQNFPSLELFERHSGIERGYGQRPHNRYYLAYESSIYHKKDEQGVVRKTQLPEVWQQFLTELEGPMYRKFIQRMLNVDHFKVRYAWHVGFSGCEVSPHIDSSDKIGTHIFYFNTSQDWKSEWGGEILILGDKQSEQMNPDYKDFKHVQPANILDNRSFLFQNSPISWHGVQPLNCPKERYRKLFNVIIEYPQARTWRNSQVVITAKKILPIHPLRQITDGFLRRKSD